MKGFLLNIICLLFSLTSCVLGVDKDYLNLVCNTTLYVKTGRRLESSTKLYYEPNVACYYTVNVDVGKKVMLLVRLFDLEAEVMNSCVDFINVHDGSSISAPTINAAPVCHTDALKNYTTSGNSMTVWFQTDSTGARLGFDVHFVAITTAPCSGGQFACNNSVCIDSTLQCNIYDECGDGSDENNCDYSTLSGLQISDDAPLIIGLTVGLIIAAIIGVLIGLWCWKQNRWRLFAKRPLTAKEISLDETTFETAYPVTKVYYKPRFQPMYRDPVKTRLHYGSSSETFSEPGSTSTKKETVNFESGTE